MSKRAIILQINLPSVDSKADDLKTLQELIGLSLDNLGLTNLQRDDTLTKIVNFTISGKLSDGTDRPAMNIGTSANEQPLHVPAGQDYPSLNTQDHRHLYVTGTKGAISCVVITLNVS